MTNRRDRWDVQGEKEREGGIKGQDVQDGNEVIPHDRIQQNKCPN